MPAITTPIGGFRVFYGTGRTYVVDNGTPLQPDTWYHVVGVYDGTLVHIYVNGLESPTPLPIDNGTGTTYVPNTNAPLRVGAGNPSGGASLFMPGWMAHVALYPDALSADAIWAHYDAATTNVAGYDAQILAEKPSGYWRFNGPSLPPDPTSVQVKVTNLGSWGTNANGTFHTGGLNTGVPGAPYHGFGTSNTACQFFGNSGSYIEIPAQPLVTDTLTITCWAMRSGNSDPWTMVYSHPSSLGLPDYGPSVPVTGIGFGNDPAGIYNNLILYYAGADANTGSYGWTPAPQIYVANQKWVFLAMTVSPEDSVLYINTQSTTNTPVTPYGTHDFSTCSSFIGKKLQYFGFNGNEVNAFNGTIDEVAIFDTALTSDQIAQIYAAAEVPPPTTTLTITRPDVSGNFSISGTVDPGLTVNLWKSTNLSLGTAGWTQVDTATADVAGAFSFSVATGADPRAYCRVK